MRACYQLEVVFLYFHGFGCAQIPKPLATQYVECVRNDKGVDVKSRKMQTPIFVSRNGDRAFGVVAAQLTPGRGCQNTTMLYAAESHSSFRLVFQQEPEPAPVSSVYDGNGIQAICWSPSGKRVLAEISQWIWGSDFGWNDKYVIFSPGDRTAHPILPVDSVVKQFKQPCGALIETTGWIDDERIELTASPFIGTDEEGTPDGTPPCVKTPVKFSFDVRTGDLQKLASGHKK